MVGIVAMVYCIHIHTFASIHGSSSRTGSSSNGQAAGMDEHIQGSKAAVLVSQ